MADRTDDVTHWLHLLQAGDATAAQPLWEEYYGKLVRLAHARLPGGGAVSDSEVAGSAFQSFCRGVLAGRFPNLDDRHDLWRLLVFITGQKVADHLERENARKRGGGFTRAGPAALEQVVGREPTPEFAAALAEEFQRLLDRLGDAQLRRIAQWKMEGYKNDEIATLAGCSRRTVTAKLELIRKILKAESVS
jgi:hypothetical protein